MATCSISRFSTLYDFCGSGRLPRIGNQNNSTSVFGDGNKVNSPTIIINNGVINQGHGAGSINSNDACGCQQQRGMMQMFAVMMATMMQMFSQLLGNNQDYGQCGIMYNNGLQGLDCFF